MRRMAASDSAWAWAVRKSPPPIVRFDLPPVMAAWMTGADMTTGTGATGTGNSAKGAPTASLTTTRNNSWVFGVGNDWDNATARTVPAGQTMVHQYLSTLGDTYWVQSMTAPTPAAGTVVTINDTAPTGDRYNLTIVEVLPSQ